MKTVDRFTFFMMEDLKGAPRNELATDLKQQDVSFHTTRAWILNLLA